jgi:hypothetical protein
MVTTKEDFDEYEYELGLDARWEAQNAVDAEFTKFFNEDHQAHVWAYFEDPSIAELPF